MKKCLSLVLCLLLCAVLLCGSVSADATGVSTTFCNESGKTVTALSVIPEGSSDEASLLSAPLKNEDSVSLTLPFSKKGAAFSVICTFDDAQVTMISADTLGSELAHAGKRGSLTLTLSCDKTTGAMTLSESVTTWFDVFLDKVDSFVWGWFLIILILCVGLFLTIRSRFVQVRHLGKALKFMVKNEEDGIGEVTSFGALCTALSATIGTGNIVGVATAIGAGGPGALFWMLLAAFFGMATKYAEGLLAVKFREDKGNGHFLGGPFYYIEKGMGKGWKWLACLFAFFGTLAGIMGIGTITQINGITSAIQNFFDPNKANVAFAIGSNQYSWAVVIGGLLVTICTAMVVIGGIKRIAKVSEIVVPFMAVTYVLFSLIILICNVKGIPSAIALVVSSAFAPKAALGAAAGITIKLAMQKGIGRGIFSNEAGLGSAPIAAAAAQTKSPVRQGLVTMTGTFIDTIVICTMTGLSIVLTGAWQQKGLEGVQVTNYAWQNGLPWNGNVSSFILMLCLAFFAFTTILGWDYYSERCLEYLTGGKKGIMTVFRWLYIVAVLVGPYLTVSAVWNIADIFNGLMALPNLIALIALSGVVAAETKAFVEAHKESRLKK